MKLMSVSANRRIALQMDSQFSRLILAESVPYGTQNPQDEEPLVNFHIGCEEKNLQPRLYLHLLAINCQRVKLSAEFDRSVWSLTTYK